MIYPQLPSNFLDKKKWFDSPILHSRTVVVAPVLQQEQKLFDAWW